ncbi:hypothetical protein PCASD_17030 [Puccinia coronata f. sp. avenae]|uniref:Uncharacterized protein n=1 Tax=Puccinia coronata f. sp. avenae TaxID=200324 RepID=A0A2N5SPZ8_9BASI|nr:hypothetical protein PCASD_17030 [Puccinia coronata f. sp. avenae]
MFVNTEEGLCLKEGQTLDTGMDVDLGESSKFCYGQRMSKNHLTWLNWMAC